MDRASRRAGSLSLRQKAREAFRRSGIRGLLARCLRYAAHRIDLQPVVRDPGKKPAVEFLAWVRSAVPGMLSEGNVDAMACAISTMPPAAPMLEIGSFCGLSTVVLSYLLEKSARSAPFFTCDNWLFEGQQLGRHLGDSPSMTHDAYRTHVKDSFVRTMQTFSSHRLPFTIESSSDEFFRQWFAGNQVVDVFGRSVTLGGNLGFCYIDGHHDYDVVKRDFENTDRALARGGLILFDDSADWSGTGVNRLVRAVASGTDYELVSRNPNYLFRKK